MNSVINFSIIIPCHNSSDFIESLLDSIPKRSDIEVILVDDYSTAEQLEATKEQLALRSYSKSSVLINTGINSAGAARNIGIAHATGKWLIFSDSDDHFTNEFSSILDKKVMSDEDVIYFRPSSDSKKSDYLARLYDNYEKGVITTRELAYEHRSPWSKIIKREIVINNDITYETSKNANDILFSAKVAFYAKKISVEADETIYFYSEREGALTDYGNIKKYDIKVKELIKRNLWLRSNLSKEDFKKHRDSAIPPCVGAIQRYGIIYTIGIYKNMRKNYFSIRVPQDIRNAIKRKLTGWYSHEA